MIVSAGVTPSAHSIQADYMTARRLISAALAHAKAEASLATSAAAANSRSAMFRSCQVTRSVSAGSRPRLSSGEIYTRSMALL